MAEGGDRLVGFTIPGRSARGRLVRLGPVLDEVLGAHAYPEPVARLLAETLALTALLGALFRPEDGQLTLQAKGQGGPVRLMVADFKDWALRGYAALDLDRRFATDASAGTLEALFGEGQLILTLDQTSSAERYQGIVELGASSLEAAAQNYFENSEQLPTLVRLAADRAEDGRWTAGGLLVQQLARSEEGGARLHVEGANPDWAHVAVLGGSVTADELADPDLSEETLLWRLFNEDEVRVLPTETLTRGCRCSVEHIRNVLEQFPEAERAEMRNADGVISVDCEFCSKQFLLEI
ncbi:Hsp33 family molecular chaperone HslO [Sandaracinobacter sp. RS1-74]|uniref:Hsp33 family molecular chaperone HslO n=1 Tax=Sandaracinobacteroides sayramensis TaxID=2913411 RepID=UPI001EDC1766|nr:Hsp33 family molecular chaperone HslO [Sandaracinobacteroides sayramensis]MCG2841796.1 Hsp33 family molecular chaperone HslO [Sandaracinobacteroides sayramensis]